jgi:hypothetical protein
VIKKYAPTGKLYHIGDFGHKDSWGLPHLETPTLWDLAKLVSQAKMLIGLDSGPAWIATCYPDVVVKKLRMRPNPPELLREWIPLEIRQIHSHWDSREALIYNATEDDLGFTWSYARI